jgi:hypothetical protein
MKIDFDEVWPGNLKLLLFSELYSENSHYVNPVPVVL